MTDSVKAFNALPRPPRSPSGKVPNNWHFDIRYITLQPSAHVLFLIQLDTTFIHMEHLPHGANGTNSSLVYFPESASAAAPVICRALIHSFLESLGTREKPYAPFKLTTEERSLALAVGQEFRRIEIRKELCTIDIVTGGQAIITAQNTFNKLWESLVRAAGLGPAVAVMRAPEPIGFSNFRLATWPKDLEEKSPVELTRALYYTRQLATLQSVDNKTAALGIKEALSGVLDLLSRKPLAVVRAEADAGNVMSAIDYALRVQAGFDGKPDRDVFRHYLVGVITDADASDIDKARAHGLLIEWHTMASATTDLRSRYIHAAAYHANECVRLSGKSFSSVLWFASRILEPMSQQSPDLLVQYKGVWDAFKKRDEEINRDTAQAEKKRAKKSNRYVCAAVDCLIQADKGKLLSQCAGKCDSDKKPSYCSKECQRSDWKIHKPFCKPGAPCSILEKSETIPTSTTTGVQEGSMSIPIVGPDGKTTLLSSSTMTVEMLKEFRKASEQHGTNATAGSSRGSRRQGFGDFHVENFMLD